MTADEFKNEILKHVNHTYNNPIILVNNKYGSWDHNKIQNAIEHSYDLRYVDIMFGDLIKEYKEQCTILLVAWEGGYEKIDSHFKYFCDTVLILEQNDYLIYKLKGGYVHDGCSEFLVRNIPTAILDVVVPRPQVWSWRM